MELFKHYPEFIFCASSAQQYEWLLEDYPETFERLQAQATAGKFKPVGGTWVEMDGNLPSGESMSR